MKKETRLRKVMQFIQSLPEEVQIDKGTVLYNMEDKGWTILHAGMLLDKLRLWYSIESACNAIGKPMDAKYLRYRYGADENLREIIDLQKQSITTKALENVINLQTQAENENVRLSSSKFILENLHDDFKQSNQVSKSMSVHMFIDNTKTKDTDSIGKDMIQYLRNSWE